ncbi:hypothetical protein [Variovorax boronicumulans]
MALAITACSDGESQKAATPQRLKPEMLATAAPGAQMACVTEADLLQAITHSVKGEKSKFAGMFQNFSCMQLPQAQKYRILSVKSTTIEFTHASNTTESVGMWADISALEPDGSIR